MPTFRHYGLRDPMELPGPDPDRNARTRFLRWDVEWQDPAPSAHAERGTSYVRRQETGWSVHELSGVQVRGMKRGDNWQAQIVIVNPQGDDVVWSSVVEEGRATSGSQFFSTHRALRSREDQRVRWRFIYFGDEPDVRVTRADWIIREY